MEITQASNDDWPRIWPIFQEVVTAGATYPYPPDTSFEEGKSIWMEAPQRTYIAEQASEVLGTYYLKPNQPGQGSHVCNCGYMVASQARGRGVATAMCRHSQVTARELGYRAMQFNLVVASNDRAVRLWQNLGFEIIGRQPQAFQLKPGHFEDAFIMHKFLLPES